MTSFGLLVVSPSAMSLPVVLHPRPPVLRDHDERLSASAKRPTGLRGHIHLCPTPGSAFWPESVLPQHSSHERWRSLGSPSVLCCHAIYPHSATDEPQGCGAPRVGRDVSELECLRHGCSSLPDKGCR
ncbi:uncharacterized protein B0I36DRAFT_327818 [Microdochium trichocladiopsis]|uniref:Uncharacterized protein n=1 Tax=Microdochium trichocladiopsis TaxID=1682393 RepID=A0A9P8Y215_9PEZI|nr:uncharacterized protein B0I36DRAFT_327818 [Microdochium trichocladiopsis]KAH7027750.1 hypothetical protein B0I36DRAFT_327818 [Microdochium trichocladiopsis]